MNYKHAYLVLLETVYAMFKEDVHYNGHAIMFSFMINAKAWEVYINDAGILVMTENKDIHHEYLNWNDFEHEWPILSDTIKEQSALYMKRSLETLTAVQYTGAIKEVNDRMYC